MPAAEAQVIVFVADINDEELWAGLDFEDPLISAVDAALECYTAS